MAETLRFLFPLVVEFACSVVAVASRTEWSTTTGVSESMEGDFSAGDGGRGVVVAAPSSDSVYVQKMLQSACRYTQGCRSSGGGWMGWGWIGRDGWIDG